MAEHLLRGGAARPDSERPAPREPCPVAFFDLDGTLLTVNSGRLWMDAERREGRIGTGTFLKGLFYLAMYRAGSVDIDAAMHEALATIAGEEESRVRERTRRWYETLVSPFAAPGAVPVLAAHRAQGHALVLLTSSSPYASECATRQFELDGYVSTVYQVRDGRFTGDFVSPLCFGEGKIRRAEQYARKNGFDIRRSYFYTDSATDLPMLERVRFPRVVNPDLRLRLEALRRGWPILDWRR